MLTTYFSNSWTINLSDYIIKPPIIKRTINDSPARCFSVSQSRPRICMIIREKKIFKRYSEISENVVYLQCINRSFKYNHSFLIYSTLCNPNNKLTFRNYLKNNIGKQEEILSKSISSIFIHILLYIETAGHLI